VPGREVAGAVETPVAPPALVGSVTVDHRPGHTSLCLETNRPDGNTPVASVTVTVKAKPLNPNPSVLSGVQEGLLGTSAIPIQAIVRLSVDTAGRECDICFRTTVATIPILTITFDNPDTGRLLTTRFPVFAGARTETRHRSRSLTTRYLSVLQDHGGKPAALVQPISRAARQLQDGEGRSRDHFRPNNCDSRQR